MKSYKKVFGALSSKGVIDVFMQIYLGCKTEEYKSFQEIKDSLKINKNTLRRITNRLSRCGLISSAQPTESEDKRKRVYIVEDSKLADLIEQIYQL